MKQTYSTSKHGMIASASKPASEAGAKILAAGGNAFDAATAVSYALGVSEPQASGMGGQSMALIYHKASNRIFALDGSSFAPYHFQPSKMPKRPLKEGVKATTLPSTVAFYGYLLETYGTMPLSEVLMPAIDLAKHGAPMTPLIHKLVKKHETLLKQDQTAKQVFFKDEQPLNVGEVFKQETLAQTMTMMTDKGWRDFYTGEIASKMVADMEQRGGWLSQEDLFQIPVPIERPGLKGKYRQYGLITFPPPGAGRVLTQILNVLETFPKEQIDLNTPLGNLILALTFRLTLRDRRRMPQHPDVYFQQNGEKMVDKHYALRLNRLIEDVVNRSQVTQTHTPPKTSGETTHFSVADKQGNIVAVTQSIELVFGAKTTAQGLGFFYNNYMSAFDYQDKTHPYYLLPGNRPYSSVAPTIITYRNRPRLVLGSPGSARISTALAQVLTRYLDQNMSLQDAVEAPRFHTSEDKKLQCEIDRITPAILDVFESTGFHIKKRDPYSFYLGCVQAIELPHQKNKNQFIGVADLRRDGSAEGLIITHKQGSKR